MRAEYLGRILNATDARALSSKIHAPKKPSDDRVIAAVRAALDAVETECLTSPRQYVHLSTEPDLAEPVRTELRARGFWTGGNPRVLRVGWFQITRWYERWLAYLTGWSPPTHP